MPLLWISLGLALSLAGDALKRVDLKWQAFALVLLSCARAFAVNFELTTTFHHLTYRLISVSLTAAGIYLLARWAPRMQVRPVYSVAGTLLLALLAFKEDPGAMDRRGLGLLWRCCWPWQHASGKTAHSCGRHMCSHCWPPDGRSIPALRRNIRGSRVQLVSVALTAGSLYLLNWITNIAEIIGDEHISQVYSWAGSLLLSWLIWYQMPAK